MNKVIKFMAALMCVAMPVLMSSCSDNDDDDVVVPGANGMLVPEQIGDYKITTNEAGKITKADNGNYVVEFEYGTFSRTTTYQVKMTKYDKEYTDDKTTIYFQLNGKGYADHALEVNSDGSEDTWNFGYNSDSQLNYIRCPKFNNIVETEITYVNGDITFVKYNHRATVDISYTNDSIATAIDNVAGIMLFIDVFGIYYMDDLEMAYYAGLLGKATKHLPLKRVDKDTILNVSAVGYFKWTLDADKYPTIFESTYTNTWATTIETIDFKW